MPSRGPRETLGGVLRAARAAKGLTLHDVEHRTGIRSGHLSQVETDGIAKPEMAILWELATVYAIDFARLLALAGHVGEIDTSGRQRRRMTVALRALGDQSLGKALDRLDSADARDRAQRLQRRRHDAGDSGRLQCVVGERLEPLAACTSPAQPTRRAFSSAMNRSACSCSDGVSSALNVLKGG